MNCPVFEKMRLACQKTDRRSKQTLAFPAWNWYYFNISEKTEKSEKMKQKEMSLATKWELAAVLKKLMAHKPISKITVRELVAECGINRNSFYYHFEDICAVQVDGGGRGSGGGQAVRPAAGCS